MKRRILVVDHSILVHNIVHMILSPYSTVAVDFAESFTTLDAQDMLDGCYQLLIIGGDVLKKHSPNHPIDLAPLVKLILVRSQDAPWAAKLALPHAAILERPFHPEQLVQLVGDGLGGKW